MLIEKKFEVAVGNIIVFRLSTGEEIIARVVVPDENGVLIVTRPRRLHFEFDQTGKMGVGFGLLMASAEDDAKFRVPYSQMIVYPLAPTKELHDIYLKQTTSLTVAPSGLIA